MSTDQMGFDLGPAPRRPSKQDERFKGDNLFIAARPDRAAAAAAQAIARDYRDLSIGSIASHWPIGDCM